MKLKGEQNEYCRTVGYKGLYKNGIVLESWTDMNRHGPNPLLLLIASRGNIRYYDARPFTPMILDTSDLAPIGNFSVRAGRMNKKNVLQGVDD